MFKAANEILGEANMKGNAVTRVLITVVYYILTIIIYPFMVLKHILRKLKK